MRWQNPYSESLRKTRHRAILKAGTASVALMTFGALQLFADDREPPPPPVVQAPWPTRETLGLTVPFRTVILASIQPARIATILSDEGQFVEKGEVVVALEDAVQAARTEIARTIAESSLSMELARAHWVQAQRDLERLVKLMGKDFTPSKEISDAQAKTETTRIEYEIAVFRQAQAARSFERERHVLGEYQLRAPFAGFVAEHLKHPGESVDALEGVVQLVQIDPLLVTVNCRLEWAETVRVGQRFLVRPQDPRWAARMGRVVLASPVIDGASQTLNVKLSVDNADRGWLAGLKVIVDFGNPLPPATDVGGASQPSTTRWIAALGARVAD